MAGSPKGPNILITGTPGTGKSTLAAELASRSGLQYLDVNAIAKENDYYDGYDEELKCKILDEDRLLDDLEDRIGDNGCIIDYHGCEMFPQRWFHIVFVLRCGTDVLYQRLENRGYSGSKLSQNMECEIMQVLLEEARESYDSEIVHELRSNTPIDLDQNLQRIELWIENWKQDNP